MGDWEFEMWLSIVELWSVSTLEMTIRIATFNWRLICHVDHLMSHFSSLCRSCFHWLDPVRWLIILDVVESFLLFQKFLQVEVGSCGLAGWTSLGIVFGPFSCQLNSTWHWWVVGLLISFFIFIFGLLNVTSILLNWWHSTTVVQFRLRGLKTQIYICPCLWLEIRPLWKYMSHCWVYGLFSLSRNWCIVSLHEFVLVGPWHY